MKSTFITPALTIFNDKGELDKEGNHALYDSLKGNVSGFVVMGSTGEFFALDVERSKALMKIAADYDKGDMKVYAGASRININESIELGQYASECGLDGVMIISPYYFSLSDEEIYTYYSRIASSISADIFLYNFPERTGYSISPEVCRRLAANCPNIVGIKDTVHDPVHTASLVYAVKAERPDFQVFTGYDYNYAHTVLSGGDGCIGGLSNIAPELFKHWRDALEQEDFQQISHCQQQVNQLMDIFTVTGTFIPAFKKALQQKGVIKSPICLPPFNEVTAEQGEKIKAIVDRIKN